MLYELDYYVLQITCLWMRRVIAWRPHGSMIQLSQYQHATLSKILYLIFNNLLMIYIPHIYYQCQFIIILTNKKLNYSQLVLGKVQIKKMNYFKSVVKNVYQKVIEDEYLQPLTQQQIYFILNNTSRKRLRSQTKDPRKMSSAELQQQLFKKVDQLGNVSPERLFRMFGSEPNIEVVAAKARQLTQNLQQVSNLMRDNFPKYERRLNQAVTTIDNIKGLYIGKKYSLQLRTKLQRLQQASQKSKRITHLHIKASNMKKLLKTLSQIPKIKKMSLTQLKSIKIQSLKNRSILGNLKCLEGITSFIDRAVASQLTQVMQILQKCLIDKFQQNLYEKALTDFLIAQHQTIKYQKLIIKLVQNHIRKIDNQLQSNINEICQFYIKLMINLHGVFRWHRLNEKEEKWQNLSKDYYNISIQIDINNITKKITIIMDECLKDMVLQKFYHHEMDNIGENLENLYLMCRMSQIAYTFSGEYFSLTLKQVTEFLYKKLHKVKEKASHELQQTLKFQEKNNWNRLPVVDNYSHETVDKTLYQMYKQQSTDSYLKVINTLKKSKTMLKNLKISVSSMNGLANKGYIQGNLWQSFWDMQQKDLKTLNNQKKQSNGTKKSQSTTKSQNSDPSHTQNLSQPQQNQQESWQIQQIHFPHMQKFQKYRQQFSVPIPPSHKTIICQYSLTILKYCELFMKYCFYFPVEPILSFCMSTISLILEYYIYHIFNSFISTNLRYIFFQKYQNLNSLQQKYHKKRLHFQYPIVSSFINEFKTKNKLTVRQSKSQTEKQPMPGSVSISMSSITNSINNLRHSTSLASSLHNIPAQNNQNSMKDSVIVRSRVVALESLGYLVMYYQHMMKLAGFLNHENHSNLKQQGINSPVGMFSPIKSQTLPNSHTISSIHPQLSKKISQKLSLYQDLYSQLSQFIYTDCIPKLCNLKDTQSTIQSIKWNDNELTINQYVQFFSHKYIDFYRKMDSSNLGEVPVYICDRLFGVFWKTQLTAIMKAFMNSYKPSKYSSNIQTSSKHKLQKFIDSLYENINSVVKQKKIYMRIPYQKMKAVFPILMESFWENAFQLLKITLQKYQFVYILEMGLILTSQSCCYLGNDDLQEKKRIIEKWIQENLLDLRSNSKK